MSKISGCEWRVKISPTFTAFYPEGVNAWGEVNTGVAKVGYI